jgi:hypothetical protein
MTYRALSLALVLLIGSAQAAHAKARWCVVSFAPVTVLGQRIPRQNMSGGSGTCGDCFIVVKKLNADGAGAITYYTPDSVDFVRVTRMIECEPTTKPPPPGRGHMENYR